MNGRPEPGRRPGGLAHLSAIGRVPNVLVPAGVMGLRAHGNCTLYREESERHQGIATSAIQALLDVTVIFDWVTGVVFL